MPEQKDLLIEACGVLEIDPQGIGFLRSSDYNYMPSPDDVFAVYKIRREDLLNLSSLFLISYQKVLWVFSNLG